MASLRETTYVCSFARCAPGRPEKSVLASIHQRLFDGPPALRKSYRFLRLLAQPGPNLARKYAARSVRPPQNMTMDGTRGFLPPSVHDLSHVDEVVEATREVVARSAVPEVRPRVHMWSGYLEVSELAEDSVFLRFALQDRLLAMATAYLGITPVLNAVEIWKSWHTPELHHTQRWHCDWDDTTQFKVYVFASRVGREDGPTTVLDASRSSLARRRLDYRFGRGRHYMLEDEELSRVVDLEGATEFTGAPGEVAFVDTSRCFHMGGRVVTPHRERILAIFQYLRPGALTHGLRPEIGWRGWRKAAPGQAAGLVLDRGLSTR